MIFALDNMLLNKRRYKRYFFYSQGFCSASEVRMSMNPLERCCIKHLQYLHESVMVYHRWVTLGNIHPYDLRLVIHSFHLAFADIKLPFPRQTDVKLLFLRSSWHAAAESKSKLMSSYWIRVQADVKLLNPSLSWRQATESESKLTSSAIRVQTDVKLLFPSSR